MKAIACDTPPAAAVQAEYETRLFVLDGDSPVTPLAHARYLALVSQKACAAEFAGRRLMLVDW